MENSFNREQWLEVRLGKFTSSDISDLLADGKREMTEDELIAHKIENPKSKTKTIEDVSILSKGALTYVFEKLAEILTGRSKEQFVTVEMQWGIDNEADAVKAYEKLKGISVEHFGGNNFRFFDFNGIAGGSPDFIKKLETPLLIGEIKCPDSKTHAKNLFIKDEAEFREVHPDYFAQLQANMIFAALELKIPLTETRGVFVSYDPRFIKGQIKAIDVLPDIDFMTRLLKKIDAAATLLNQLYEEIE